MRLKLLAVKSAVPLLLAALCTTVQPVWAAASRHATGVTVERVDEGARTEVVVRFSAPPSFSARMDPVTKRLAIDVVDADIAGAPPAIAERDGLVAGVLTQGFTSEGRSSVRVLLTLRTEARYGVTVRGSDLVVTLMKGPLGPLERTAAAPVAPATSSTLARVDDLRFERAGAADRIRLRLAPTPSFRTRTVAPGTTRLVLDGTSLPKSLERLLDVRPLGGKVTAVASFVDPAEPNRVIIEVDHDPKLTFRVERESGGLVMEFFEPGTISSSFSGVARDGGIARRTRTVSVEAAPADLPEVRDGMTEHSTSVERSTPAEAAQAVTPGLFGQERADRGNGRRIDLDLKDADVHNVLRLLAEVGRVNIVTADNVSGQVTIRMRNVPWDQALDVILQSKNLGMVRQNNLIRVAPLADLEKERELAIARRKQEVQLAPVETRLIPVSYANAADVQQRARDLLSERGSIAVDERTNVMIVRDVVGNLNQVEELTRALDTQTPQVLVEARIVEATSRYLRDVGIQWGGDTTFAPTTGNPTGLAFPNSVGVVGGASDSNTPTGGLSPIANRVETPNFAVNLPAAVGTGQGGAIGLSFGSIDNTINLAVRLSAAEANGMLRILSSPRILTLDNREARISQGTLIPFSQVSAQGVQTTFQEAKLQLLVRPHVTADGSVSMKVKINRDEPDFNQTSARGDPTILKREAETELLVMDGHTAVIGGIYTRNTGRNLDQVPFFGDIPILGLLFQRRRASDSRGELVIFLTPRIVNRAEALGR